MLVAARISNKTYVNFFIGYPLMVFASMAVVATTFILIESPFFAVEGALACGQEWAQRS
jgi:hypothetical protein